MSITKEQADKVKSLARAYAVAMVDKWNKPDAITQQTFHGWKEEMIEYIDSLTEKAPQYYVVRVGEHFLHNGYDSEGGYLGELKRSRRFDSKESAAREIEYMPHKENRDIAAIVLYSEVTKENS